MPIQNIKSFQNEKTMNEDKDIIDALIMLITERNSIKRLEEDIQLKKITENKKNKQKVLEETEYYMHICTSYDKYFRCKICDSRYSYIRVMQKHLKKDHDIIFEKPLTK
ncbi:hypothetical protein CDIK_2684 [Cucumispora dikerogammari]|nr:hypothetical protein CDIK_2684 [Cucumispora dikerogammari]